MGNDDAMEALFRIEMLGRFEVRHGSREITRFRTQKTASLLACLALYRSRSHPREVLIERFWPDSLLKAARTNLSVALNALRRQLEPPGVPEGAVLITDHTQVRLNRIAFTTDVEDFENALRAAESESEAAKRLASWMTAVDLYRGDLLPGFYEDWVLTERDRLRDAYLAALRHTVMECAALRQRERAIEYAHRLVQADPLREEAHRLLMRLLIAVGRPHDALHHYQELERLLQNELQLAPSATTRELAAQLRHLPPTRRKTREAPASGSLQQAMTADVHPPATGTQRPTLRIPLQFTRFFGREEEMERLCGWMGVGVKEDGHTLIPLPRTASDPSARPRLITLTGPGGTGKTRLAIESAGRVKEAFPGGIWFVPLAELHDPLRLGEALRDALELPRLAHLPTLDQVIAFLSGLNEPSLLILDNFEQISAGGAPIVWTLLNRVPSLQCLVTSRQPLALPGEREVPVLPLPIPVEEEGRRVEGEVSGLHREPRILLTYPGVALFVDRAQAARPEFQITPRNGPAIAAICQRVEGIPLAIELAAARAKTLTPAQILERLAERFELLASRHADKGERHRSLWAAIDWSYHLLSPDLQRLFARLSVFHGGWTLEAAEAVCKAEATGQSLLPLDALAQLRGHSLVRAEESSETIRFRMLETLREFAAEQLRSEEREETERRHAAYFHAWVTGAQFGAPERTAWFARFESDLDNLRAVLAWSLREGNDIEIGLQTAGALSLFWHLHGHLSEGRRWYASLLERAGEAPTVGLGQSLYGAGALASQQGDFEAASPLLERCLEVVAASGDELIRGLAHNESGSIALFQGDHGQARIHYEKSLSLSRAQGRRDRVAAVLGNLANLAHCEEDVSTSRTLNVESLALWREVGDRLGEARVLHNLGLLAWSERQLEDAREFYAQSLDIKRELADRFAIVSSLMGLSAVARDQEDYAAAVAYAREALVSARELNVQLYLVNGLTIQVEVLRAIGAFPIVARMYGALERLWEERNYPLRAFEQEGYQQAQRAVREALGAAVYESAKTEGSRLSLEQALACVEETLASHSL
jgi:predicted ATPase/DNA-binding SARP family transcriptional activator